LKEADKISSKCYDAQQTIRYISICDKKVHSWSNELGLDSYNKSIVTIILKWYFKLRV
jgi:hypothetical protein